MSRRRVARLGRAADDEDFDDEDDEPALQAKVVVVIGSPARELPPRQRSALFRRRSAPISGGRGGLNSGMYDSGA